MKLIQLHYLQQNHYWWGF